MSEERKEAATVTQLTRRSMLKWTAGLALAGAAGIGIGYGASELLRPAVTKTETVTVTAPLVEEQVFVTSAQNHGSSRGEPIRVRVRSGRIASVEPFELTEEEANSTWTITAGGRTFKAARKCPQSPLAMALRSRTYAPDRLRYPMKRVGFESGGKGDVSNRGKGEFVRITWNEALDTVANEVKRIKETYGNSAIFAWGAAHPETGCLHGGSMFDRFLEFLGGYTEHVTFQDSAGYWSYAGPFTWGFRWNHGAGDRMDLLEDTLKNSKLVVNWGTDPIQTGYAYGGAETAHWGLWTRELGIRQISINPKYTDTAAIWCDQWIPIKPQTDVAMALAIAYLWITEGTYDKSYVATHAVGFDKFSDYILGSKDGPDGKVARTPEWAEKITGVPAKTIIDLAREWASKPTMLHVYESGLTRSSYGHEWCRMMILLQAMQGVGKPGVNLSWGSIKGRHEPMITNMRQVFRGPRDAPGVAKPTQGNPVMQKIHRLRLAEAVLTDFTKAPPLKWRDGTDAATWEKNEDVFLEYTYPMPGYSEIRMVWRFGGGQGLMGPNPQSHARMYKSPKIEFVVIQVPRLEPEAMFADIILPANVNVERSDLSTSSNCGYLVLYMPRMIEPLGESKTDYEMFTGVAERLGFKAAFSESNSEDDWLRKIYASSTASKTLSWEAFKAKGYYAPPFPKDYKPAPNLRWFYEKPEGSGLDTPSGKIEFQSRLLTDFFGEGGDSFDVPKWFVSPFGPYGERAKKYPLGANSGKTKFRDHTKWQNAPFLSDLYKHKGHEPFWINPADAGARGIKEKDIVRIFNDTGQILCYAHITERMAPGAVWVPWGSWYKPAEPGNPDSIDVGGCFNTLVSLEIGSEHGRDTYEGNVMVQVEKWEG